MPMSGCTVTNICSRSRAAGGESHPGDMSHARGGTPGPRPHSGRCQLPCSLFISHTVRGVQAWDHRLHSHCSMSGFGTCGQECECAEHGRMSAAMQQQTGLCQELSSPVAPAEAVSLSRIIQGSVQVPPSHKFRHHKHMLLHPAHAYPQQSLLLPSVQQRPTEFETKASMLHMAYAGTSSAESTQRHVC